MIICICGTFPKYDRNSFPTGEKEFVVSHGVDADTLQGVVLPNIHPQLLGATFDHQLMEWIL